MVYRTGILLGQITKTSGFEGAVLVRLEKNFIEEIPDLESVFVEIDGRPVPFFIDWSEYRGADILNVKFNGYDSRQQVEEFRGCNVFLTDITHETSGGNGFRSILDFTVTDQDKKIIGRVTGITENPGQLMLNIESPSKKEILVPFHQDLITALDKRKKVIIMNLPEGLLEINS